MEFLSDALDENLFITFDDYSLVDKFLTNEFINANFKFVLGDLPGYFNNLEDTLVDTGIIFDLSNFLVNQLCSSVLIVNK
jgi:hypothetical protein